LKTLAASSAGNISDENGGGPGVRLRRPPACPKNSSQGVCYFTGVGAGICYREGTLDALASRFQGENAQRPRPFLPQMGGGVLLAVISFC